MFRVTTRIENGDLVVKVEGSLAEPWVRELEACWRETVPVPGAARVTVDLTAVCHVDDSGRVLMERMYRDGASFIARGCVMPEVVREIAEAAGVAVAGGRS